MTRINPILKTDSYKASHYLQYPPKTEYVTSYIEPRGISRKWPGEAPSLIPFVGLQKFINDLCANPVTAEDVEEAKEYFEAHGLPFNYDGWMYIVKQYHGHLPLEIQALPEGSLVTPGIPVVQVQNTDPKCFWLTSYIETALLRAVWYPTTVATISYQIKQKIRKYLNLTSDSDEKLPFMLHDFGARGTSSSESAAIGGFAHICNFMGTDTVEALVLAKEHYYAKEMPAFSIPAAEHSTITSWGEKNESAAYENMVRQFGGDGKLVAVVSDSYDIYNACKNIWGDELKDLVLSQGGTVVIRPDSGDPAVVVRHVLDILGERFGYTINTKGFRRLPPQLAVIQGDGINNESIEEISRISMVAGWATDNLAYGMGGALLQHCDRDWLQWAMKCNEVVVDKEHREVYKRPIEGGKSSKPGRQAVYMSGSKFVACKEENLPMDVNNELRTVYINGSRYYPTSLDQIRERIETQTRLINNA